MVPPKTINQMVLYTLIQHKVLLFFFCFVFVTLPKMEETFDQSLEAEINVIYLYKTVTVTHHSLLKENK